MKIFLIGLKLLRIRFDKIDGFIKVCDGSKYLVLLDAAKYDAVYNRIRYLISLKSRIRDALSHYYSIFKVDSYDYLPIKKTLILYNVIILIKSVLNKDKNHYYCKIFLEKCSYQLAKK